MLCPGRTKRKTAKQKKLDLDKKKGGGGHFTDNFGLWRKGKKLKEIVLLRERSVGPEYLRNQDGQRKLIDPIAVTTHQREKDW